MTRAATFWKATGEGVTEKGKGGHSLCVSPCQVLPPRPCFLIWTSTALGVGGVSLLHTVGSAGLEKLV